jgi:uncharacterized protein YdbL (DUF1318 family)
MKAFHFSVLLSFFFSSALSLTAADLREVKSDMKERKPAIEALWAAGKIGENNRGFVEARASLKAEEKKLLQAENADRKIVYQAIARSARTTPEKVGTQRAAQISQRAAKGLWLEDAEGNWYRK